MALRTIASLATTLALTMLFAAPDVDAHRARTVLLPVLRTPVGAPLPAATVLVAALQSFGAAAVPADWHGRADGFPADPALERDGTRIALRVELVTPGLARLVPARTPPPGRWRVLGLARPAQIELRARPLPAAATPPPAIRVDRAASTVTLRHGGTTTIVRATVRLGAAVPAEMLAVFAAWSAGGGAFALFELEGPFAALSGPTSDVMFDATPTDQPAVGQTARITWIDRYGRSIPSASPVPVVAGL